MAERYRQFVIIALGVSIFVTGTTFSMSEYTLERAWALLVVFTTVVLMWRIYIYRAGELLTDAIARSSNPALLTQSAAVTHLIMVAGIVGAAVTSQLVVSRPLGETPPSWAAVILGGPALYLVGRGVLDFTVFGRISRSRLAGLVLLAGLAPATPLLPPLLVALLAMTVLAPDRRGEPGEHPATHAYAGTADAALTSHDGRGRPFIALARRPRPGVERRGQPFADQGEQQDQVRQHQGGQGRKQEGGGCHQGAQHHDRQHPGPEDPAGHHGIEQDSCRAGTGPVRRGWRPSARPARDRTAGR